jgi:squalene synthase HpnC
MTISLGRGSLARGSPDPAVTVLETPSGKGSATENFPVGSLLIRTELRRHVHRFYRFARAADDVADNPDLPAAEKLRRLDLMAAALGDPADSDRNLAMPAAAAMADSLAETGIGRQHCHDLLHAFRQDAVKQRYADWDELMSYCRYSAAPVGRYLLDLHGEAPSLWDGGDALCAALQILNHIQDCARDFIEMDRIYLPQDWLAAGHTGIADLRASRSSAGLRRCLDLALEGVEALARCYRPFPRQVRDPRLRAESAAIVGLADRLTERLRRGDPLARRIKPGRVDFAMAGVAGAMALLRGPRP